MIRVELFTRDGGFVAAVLLPPYQRWPEAVIWGTRIFVRASIADQTPPSYVEGFAVVACTAEELERFGLTPTAGGGS